MMASSRPPLKPCLGPGESLTDRPEWSKWTSPQLSDDLTFQVRAARTHSETWNRLEWLALPWYVRLWEWVRP